ncbi:hypothetical protein IMG5_124520 [Ichthyophthirius multifiliis]|uniref:Cilia- and flagella-associated protein 58 central coiled coil domain-containing protein n=1 Tax=Ichthyophthirius multifiliis TaxID=5932 RepID=G0QVL7_ICHMU|nr:hypothetical protein IMG5_124520 [Ichthyophthirius multifiliis]EGR30740.1 hypothetical protein IMG5_124520 [Ichthyophthirius multifiliis]|eukprot:XP_004032327.1 hypothetical protein IMG5_124520 [Ichthyophthirius multifiliis]
MDADHYEEKQKIIQDAVEKQKQIRDKLKDEIDGGLKERTQNNKNLKKAEDDEHFMDEDIIYLLNKLKKIENQILGYEVENEKLSKMITQLQKEQEKYGIEATQAHAKYYQTCEEVKIKINQIAEQKQKNNAILAKLKHQQHLYEAVRSDQLEKERVMKAIKSTEEVIKNQENHISRLKYTIQELKAEQQRLQKDLEMVVNERDILSTQLIKRNQELKVLEEKIKLQQSNLTKGEIFYREKQLELQSLKNELNLVINELKNTQEQISCIPDLRNEINLLQKDILAEKTKIKALQDELENPLNVHRWRKLEATDQDNFERILKIQTLQRRLIAKTEEVQEKEKLIKEKEKLFMELKSILARQPGPEIHQQLVSYKDSLKEKTGQMKKMLAEIKNTREQMPLQINQQQSKLQNN